MVIKKVSVLTRSVCWVDHCIRKKPGEPLLAAEPVVSWGACRTLQWWCTGVVPGYGGTGHGADPCSTPWYGSGCSQTPFLGQNSHFSVKIGHFRVKTGQNRPFSGQTWSKSGQIRSSWVEIGSNSVQLGQKSVQLGQKSVQFGPVGSEIGPVRSSWVQ